MLTQSPPYVSKRSMSGVAPAMLAMAMMLTAPHAAARGPIFDEGGVWVFVCSSLSPYYINLATGEKRHEPAGQNDPSGTLGCHNSIGRREAE